MILPKLACGLAVMRLGGVAVMGVAGLAGLGAAGLGAAYLLRPDQHVCARWLTLDAARLQAALDAALPQ